jgi:hypothetical protein
MDNIKHREDFFNEEETANSPLNETKSLIDYENIRTIPLEDRFYILSTIQRALNIYLDSYVRYCNDNNIEELRDKVISTQA